MYASTLASPLAPSSRQKSNIGAIVGGVAGGLVVPLVLSVSRCCLKRSAPPSANNALHSQQGSLQEIYEEVWPLELDEQALLELNEQRFLEMQGGARAVELNGHFNTAELQARADHQ